MSVQNVITRDTGRDLTPYINEVAAAYDFDAVGFLGGAIAESNLDERSSRLGVWPDVSYGLFHSTVKYIGLEVEGIKRDPSDGTALDTPKNRRLVREFMWDGARAIVYAAPRYKTLLDRWGDPLEAWCRWNKPGVPGAMNPNRANYVRGLARAEAYRMAAVVGEGIANKMREAGDSPVTHEWEEIHGLSVQKKAWGMKGLYVSSQDGGDWMHAGPFGLAE